MTEDDSRRSPAELVTLRRRRPGICLALDAVLEVLDAPETLAALPASEELVLGVTPFRDTLLPLLSLRGLLGFRREARATAREGGRHQGRRRPGRPGGRPHAHDLRRRRRADRDDPAGAGRPRPAAKPGSRRSTAATAAAGWSRSCRRSSCSGRTSCSDLKAGGGTAPEATRRRRGSRGEERQFVVFRLGDDEFGLPIEAVDEVARVPDQITRLPKTPKFLEGVVNLRGEVLPVVDQRRRFDMPALEEQGARRLIVVRTERHRAGLIVDAVLGGAALLCRRHRAGARPDRRSRPPGPRRDQSREGGPHRAAARSRRAADPRRARPARRVRGQDGDVRRL